MEKLNIIIFLFFLLIKLDECIVVIPFKTFKPENIDIKKSEQTVLEPWRQNILYTNIKIGSPPQDIIMIINSESYITNLYQHMCDISESLFNKTQSSSFIVIRPITYFPMVRAAIIDETIYFYSDLKMEELQAYNLLKLIYSDNKKEDQSYMYEYHNNTCLDVGFKLNHKMDLEKEVNLINQLAQNFKESYDFTFKYTSDNEGMIIIGAEPHIFDPDNYQEQNYRTVGAGDNDFQDYRDWHLTFDEMYVTYKDKNTNNIINKNLNETKKIRINFDLGIIYGPTDYKIMIKNLFFDDLIEKEICFEIKKELEIGFYCDKNKGAEEIIKNEFPTLYFKMNQFNEIFELNYKDLFREKEKNKLYFLIVFSQTSQNYFEIGKIFLKKYIFTFNQDAKTIGYYINTKKPNPSEPSNPPGTNDDSFFTSIGFIILISCVIIAFSILGFFVGKSVYDKIRKRRRNELDDLYEYKSEEEEKKDSIINNNSEETNESDHLGINDEEGTVN